MREDQFSSHSENFSEFSEYLYWIDEQNLFDNRKRIAINFAPIKFYRNSENISARIFEASVEIIYTSPIDIIDFKAKNISLGEEEIFYLKLKGNGKINITILIEGEDYTEEISNIEEISGIEEREFYWKPKKEGDYIASVVMSDENNNIGGPISTRFFIRKLNILQSLSSEIRKLIKILISPTKEEKESRTPLEAFREIKENGSRALEYKNPERFLRIEFLGDERSFTFIQSTRELRILETSERTIYSLNTPIGRLTRIKELGNISSRCEVNCEILEKELASALILINETLSYINEKYNIQ